MVLKNSIPADALQFSGEETIDTLRAEIARLKGFENIVNGLMEHQKISLGLFQKIPPKAVFVNRGFEILSGYTREEITGFSLSDFEKIIHPDMREEFFQRYYKRITGGMMSSSYELKIVRKDGKVLNVQAFVYPVVYNGEPSVVITIVDMTKMKETEQALRNRTENYRLLFNRTPVSIFYYDNNLCITNFNDRFVELLQSTREKLAGLDLHTIHDRSILPCIEAAVNGHNGSYRGKYCATTSNAEIVVSMKCEPLHDEAGEITGGVGIIEDIKKVYETEEALVKSEEKFKDMIDRSPLPIAITDMQDNVVYNNRECFNLFGFRRSNITDLKSWWNSAYPDPVYRKAVIDDWYTDYKNSQNKREMFGPKEYNVSCADGTVRNVEFHVVPVGDLSFIIMNDITRHRQAEAELLKTRKIESLGILAGGIAHDFNNILTAIIGNLNLAKLDITREHNSYSLLDTVEKAAWRARDLTQQLLTFSRGGSPVKKKTSVKQLLVDSAQFVLAGSGIRPEFRIADDIWDAEIDEGQISQVMHNIVLNAKEAMTDTGVMKLSAENFKCEGVECLIFEGEYIRIRVEDSGGGIPSSIISNIFDPFFTTKPSGTGLGLSVSYSIVRKHGGDIKVSSVDGEGAVFDVYLPAWEEKCHMEINPERKEPEAKRRILVMDDENLILDISKKMLTRMGYDVEVAISGEESVALYKQAKERGEPFDCVIMDLTIPGGMGGKDTLLILKEYDPAIKAIVSSGYSNDPVMSRYEEYGFAGVSGKPYSFEQLRDEIERVIAKK